MSATGLQGPLWSTALDWLLDRGLTISTPPLRREAQGKEISLVCAAFSFQKFLCLLVVIGRRLFREQ